MRFDDKNSPCLLDLQNLSTRPDENSGCALVLQYNSPNNYTTAGHRSGCNVLMTTRKPKVKITLDINPFSPAFF